MSGVVSKSSNASTHGEWKDQKGCTHDYFDWKVNEIRWIKVLMSSEVVKDVANIGRNVAGALTLGLSDRVFKDLSHECIEILATCLKCGSRQCYTAEILGEKDKRFREGFYNREVDIRYEKKLSFLLYLGYVKKIFDEEMDDSYNVLTNNCGHWSSCLWKKL